MTGSPDRPRVIVCDLDGTLLNSRGEVGTRTRAVLREAQRAGWPLLLSTARPVRHTRPVVQAIDEGMVAVCGNGSITYDFGQDRIVDYRPIPSAGLAETLAALRAAHPRLRLGAECELELILEEGFALAAAALLEARWVASLESAIDERGIGKIILQLAGDPLEYCTAVSAALPERLAVTVSGADFCEITLAGVTKAAAVERIVERLGFSHEDVLAFGDMPNDLPVLRWAGTGVAMANAHPDVLAVADVVTTSNDDDGVARLLERLLDGRRPDVPAALIADTTCGGNR
jgi:Cof subfamily protein (haloacid dehalogenase superfamily)